MAKNNTAGAQAPATTTTTTEGAKRGPKKRVFNLALYGAPANLKVEDAKALTLPDIISPAILNESGSDLFGTVVDVMKSPVSTYKSALLVMENDTSGAKVRFCFPVTAVIARAIRSEFNVSEEAEITDVNEWKAVVGATLLFRPKGTTATKDGERTVNLFDVHLISKTPKPATPAKR